MNRDCDAMYLLGKRKSCFAFLEKAEEVSTFDLTLTNIHDGCHQSSTCSFTLELYATFLHAVQIRFLEILQL